MRNQVELGIQINVAGTRQGAGAIDQMTNSTDQLGNAAVRTSARVQAAQTSQAASTANLQSNQAALNEALQPYAVHMGNAAGAHRALQNETHETTQRTDRMGMSARQTAAALRMVPAQFTDIITSLQGGQNPLTVFLQQGGQLRDMFGSAGAAARGLGGYVLSLVNPFTVAAAAAGILALAYYQGSEEADAYNRSIIMTGNIAGTSASQLGDMASNISKVTGTQSQAAAALAELVGSGKVAGDNLQRFGQVAVDLEKTVGRSTAETVKDLSELGKAPLQASLKLSEQYHYLTAATYSQIKALEDQGRMDAAASVAQNAYADAMAERNAKVVSNLGTIEKAWAGVKSIAKGAWDAMLDIGREDTFEQKLSKAEAALARAERARFSYIGGGADGAAELARARAKVAELKTQRDADEWTAKAKAESVKLEEAHVNWLKEGTQYLTRQQQMEQEINATRQKGLAAGVSDADIDARIDQVKKKYADLNGVVLANLEARRGMEREHLTLGLADLDSQQKRQLVSYGDFVAARRDLQLKDLNSEIAATKRQAELAGGKADLAERVKYLGQLAVLEERRKGIVKSAQNALDEYAYEATKAIKDKAKAWEAATASERAALTVEVGMFGQSAEARGIVTEQMRIEAEARQLIASLQANGRVLGEQELTDIKKAAQVRKDSVAALMGERQALSGADQLRRENQRFAADSIMDERGRAAAVLKIDADQWQERIRLAGEGTDAQRLLQAEYTTWYANHLAKPQLDAQRQFWESVDKTAHDTFVSILDGGKDMAQRLRDTLKNVLFDWLYQMTLKKWIVNLSGSVGVGGIPGIGQAGASNAGGVGSLLQTANGVYDAIGNGFTGLATSVGGMVSTVGNFFGSSAVSAFGSGMGMTSAQAAAASQAYGAAGMSGTGSAISAGSTVGGMATAAAGIAGGIYGGRALSAGYSAFGGSGNSAVNTGTAVGAVVGSIIPVIGTAVGALIGGLLGGAVNRLFGHKPKEYTDETIQGTLSDGGFSGSTYSNWTQKGGLFRSDKHGTDIAPIEAELATSFTDTYAKLKEVSGEFAAVLGADISSLAGRSQAMSVVMSKDVEANKTAIANFFLDVGDTLARELVPNLQALQLEGESASAALQRLAGDYHAVDMVLATIGRTSQDAFGAVGLASVAAREQLIKAAGGVDSLASGTAYFAQNFLSQQEQMAPIIANVTTQLAALGQASIRTDEEFKNAVLGLDLSSQAGAETMAKMLQLAPQFKQMTDYTESLATAVDDAVTAVRSAADIAAERADIQRQIDQLAMTDAQRARAAIDALNRALYEELEAKQAAKAAAEQLVAVNERYADQITSLLKARMSEVELRAFETAEMDKSTVTLYDRLHALEAEDKAAAAAKAAIDAKVAADKAAADALAATNKAYEDQITAILKSRMSEVELRAFETAEMDATTVALYDMLHARQAEENAYAAAAAAIEKAKDSAAAAEVKRNDKVAAARADLSKAYDSESAALKQTIDNAKQFVKSLLSFKDSLLLGALSPLTTAQKYSEAAQQYQATLAKAMAGDTAAQGQYQSAAEAFLKASQEANASDGKYQADFASVLQNTSAAAAWASQQVDVAAASLEALNAQVDGLSDINESVLSVAEAVAALAKAMDATSGPDNASRPTSAIEELYQDILGRQADAAGLKYWQERMASGTTLQQVAKEIYSSPEYGNAPRGSAHPLAPIDKMTPVMPALDFSGLGTANTVPLVAAIKELQATNDAMAKELAGLRADQQRQTGDMIGSNIDANLATADAMATSIERAAEKTAYMERTRALIV